MQAGAPAVTFATRMIGVAAVLAACSDTRELDEASDDIAAQICAASAADERAAETMARACGNRVEVEAGRSEYSELYVEPSGLRTLVTSVAPQRARQLDGAWGPIDTTLIIAPPSSVIQWAYASVINQGTSTTDNTVASGDYSPASTVLKVGNDPDSSHVIRSFMRFSIGAVADRQILAAKISGRVDHTTKCSVFRPTYFYRSEGIAVTPRQAWPGPALQLLLGSNSVHANEKSCNEPNMPFEVTSGTLIADLQAFATARASDYFVAISAGENTGGFNETHSERWMRYFLNDFQLHSTYNTRDPQQMHGYAYANNAPITAEDADGLWPRWGNLVKSVGNAAAGAGKWVYNNAGTISTVAGVAAMACAVIPPLQVLAPVLGAVSAVAGAIDTARTCATGSALDCAVGVAGMVPGGRALKALGEGVAGAAGVVGASRMIPGRRTLSAYDLKPGDRYRDNVIWNKNRGVDFSESPYLFPAREGQRNIVSIEYQGRRKWDYKAANLEGKIGTHRDRPADMSGTTWMTMTRRRTEERCNS